MTKPKKQWIIFNKFGKKEYILDSTNLDVSHEELSKCIEEQIYGGLY